jgi:hypothetical protein
MISVTGPLWLWSGGQERPEADRLGDGPTGRWHFLTVPEDQAMEIRAHSLAIRGGFGSVRVEVAIGEVRWRTSVFPQKSGGYILPVKASVRRDAAIAAGDEVRFELEIL